MKNLKNYAIQELSMKEIRETEAGCKWPTLKEWNKAVGDFNDAVYAFIDRVMP